MDESAEAPSWGVNQPVPAVPAGTAAADGPRVNINTASLAQLDELPGIGPAIAQNILDYRDANGPFATIEAIMEVSGIGQAKFAQLEDLIIVAGE